MHYLNPHLLHKRAGAFAGILRSGRKFIDRLGKPIAQVGKNINNNRLSRKMLRDLYPGTTPLPKKLQFKYKDTEGLLRGYDKNGFAMHRFDSVYSPNNKVVTFTHKHPLTGQTTDYRIPYELQPTWNMSEKLWESLGSSSNKQAINLQAGDPNYFGALQKHIKRISKKDQIRAGIRTLPEREREEFGRFSSIKPKIKYDPIFGTNAYYDPQTLSIDIIMNPHATFAPHYAKDQFRATLDLGMPDYPIEPGSPAFLGTLASHEFGHSTHIPLIASHDPCPNVSSTPFGKFTARYATNCLYAPLFSSVGHTSRVRQEVERFLPIDWGWRDDIKRELKAYGLDQISANPILRNKKFKRVYPKDYPEGYFDYAYEPNEIPNAMILLNRGQNLAKRTMKQNRQAYINAGFRPEDIDEFIKFPRFNTSPGMFDRRMEFYARHPEFMHIVGEEPSRVVSRYFMLERESRNPLRTTAERKSCRDMLDFIRANYWLGGALPPLATPFVYRQMQQNNSNNTWMDRYM